MHKPYKKIKMYKSTRPFIRVSTGVSVKALLCLAYFHDWNLSTFYSSSLIYYSSFQINIYKNLYVLSDTDNFKKLSLVIS